MANSNPSPGTRKKVKVGILGCGAIGSGIARSIRKELKDFCEVSGVYDLDQQKAALLAKKLSSPQLKKNSFPNLLKSCNLMVEAVSSPKTKDLVKTAIQAKKNVLAMSVGKLLNANDVFSLATKNNCSLLIPSGAIAGIDAVKSASLVKINNITLTTRKPTTGFANNAYLKNKGINPTKINKETVIFEGKVANAVKFFPQNINVAATLAIASKAKSKITIRIITSPKYKTNSHEIDMTGSFGRIVTRTENVICPDNPKTSYLAVLSGIQTLKDFCLGVKVGT